MSPNYILLRIGRPFKASRKNLGIMDLKQTNTSSNMVTDKVEETNAVTSIENGDEKEKVTAQEREKNLEDLRRLVRFGALEVTTCNTERGPNDEDEVVVTEFRFIGGDNDMDEMVKIEQHDGVVIERVLDKFEMLSTVGEIAPDFEALRSMDGDAGDSPRLKPSPCASFQ